MSTPQEYRRVADELAQLRTAVEALADQMVADGRELLKEDGLNALSWANCTFMDAKMVRALLDAQ